MEVKFTTAIPAIKNYVKPEKNFHPCVEAGLTDAINPLSDKQWSRIGWKTFFRRGNDIAMQCYFYATEDDIDARATFLLNIDTGAISEFMFENVHGIDIRFIDSLASSNISFERSKKARKDVERLAKYFYGVNVIEYQKAMVPRPVINAPEKNGMEGYGFIGQFAQKTPAHRQTDAKALPYDPVEAKKPAYVNCSSSKKQRKYQLKEWQVHGFYRRTKKGLVYIAPHTRRRRVAI